jgi:hypothetical protein
MIGGRWQEFTDRPYNAEPSNYTDPFWSNIGAGFSLVGGRVTALASTPDGAWFAGTADGGVWRSFDQGQHWTPVFDSMPTLSIGALAVDPVDGSLWVGTGEANTSQDSYAGTGVYRSRDDGATWRRVGDDGSGSNPLVDHTVFRIAFDQSGDAYAATNNGLFRLAAGSRQWTEVLDPAGPTDFPPYDQQVTDVAVVPASGGSDVIAAIGWHGPGNTENNGFYESTDGGLTFSQVTPTGDINAGDIGRTTFAYSADGSKLYAIVQSPAAQGAGAPSVLQGIFVATGSPASVTGPWTKIADAAKLAASGIGGADLRLARRADLVQPGPRRRPEQPGPRLRRARRSVRVGRRRQHVDHGEPVLELQLRLRRHEPPDVPERHAPRPARHDDHRREDRHRQ